MKRILLVDDEKNILSAYKRNMSDEFDIVTAESAMEAIDILSRDKSFLVIVSDYKMPKMNGVELLEKAKTISPDTIQIMLTGQAEIEAIIDLINKGKVFRFLTKPCSTDDLVKNINDGIRQYELLTVERELLGKTLGGSIKVLTDLLALAKPQAFHKTQKIRNLARNIISEFDIENKWQIEIAAMLSQIGCVTIPDDILKKIYRGLVLSEPENVMYLGHPSLGADMIKNIPRMEAVAEIIRYQFKNFDGSGFPPDDIKENKIPAGSRILKIAIDFDNEVTGGTESDRALLDMSKKAGIYDPEFLQTAQKKFIKTDPQKNSFVSREVPVDSLDENMYLAEDLVSASGVTIGSRNQKLTAALIATIKNYAKSEQIKDNVRIVSVLK